MIMDEDQGGTETNRTVDAVNISIDIIEASHSLQGARLTDLAEHLELSKSTVHSHLRTLEGRELLTREGNTYRPSYRFIKIAETLRQAHYEIYRFGRDQAEQLAEETGETVQLMIEEHGVGIHVYNTSTRFGLYTDRFHVGRACPLHCVAAGKAILAHLEADDLEAVIRSGLNPVTDQTITDPGVLRDELEQVRKEGVAFSSEEAVQGMRGIAAPVLGTDSNPIGSINISGPITKIKGERFRKELAQKVLKASNELEITIMNEQEYGQETQDD